MADFAPAVTLVLRHEGGFVANPNDPGGPTNMGITQAVFSSVLARAATLADMKAMTVAQAQRIYKVRYWNVIAGDKIDSQDVANWALDMAVLRGATAASMSLQQAVGATADGAIGPKTLAAVNEVAPAVLLNSFRSLCLKKLAAIVTARPQSLEFLSGWVKRAEEMSETVNLLLQKTVSPSPRA